MSREFFIFHAGKSVVSGGMYDREAAEKVAQNAARRHPGRTYTVMERVAAFQFPRVGESVGEPPKPIPENPTATDT